MRSKTLVIGTVYSLAIVCANLTSFQHATSIPAASAGEKPDVTADFVKGSVWKGREVATKPKPSTVTWQLTVIERDGQIFTAQLVSSGNFRRRVEGTIKKDGSFTWKGAAGEPNPGHPHEGKIFSNKIDFNITPTADGPEAHGTFTLVPPDVSTAFVKGTVWKGTELVTKPRQVTTTWELTVIERKGEKYTAQLVSTGGFSRRVEGTITSDGSFTWKGAAGEPNPGHPHEGKINGSKIDFTITPIGDGLEAHGSFTFAGQRKPWAVILCKFSELPNYEPHPVNFYKEAFTEAGAGKGREFDYFRQVTYGHIDMTGSKVFGWFNMPKHSAKEEVETRETIPHHRVAIHEWGVEVAKDNKIDLTPFYGVLVIFNNQTDNGSAERRHRVVLGYNKTDWDPTYNCHELGHGFDLNHSWFARPDTDYGDRWDLMSSARVFMFNNAFGRNGPGLNAYHLRRLGCIPPERIWESTGKSGSQTVTLAALNQFDAKGYLMATIPPTPGSDSKTSYLVEFRRKTGWDAAIPQDTLLVHEDRSNNRGYLLSRKNPGNERDVASIQVLPGQEFKIAERNLTIRAESFDTAESTAKVTITIAK
jgi:hypothetical protein